MTFDIEQFKHDCIMYGTFAAPIIVVFSVIYYFTRDIVVSAGGTASIFVCLVLTLAAWYLHKSNQKA